MPDFFFENQHDEYVCGIDEVGRGPLAGPLVAAAVVIPSNVRDLDFVGDITDSKKLSISKREMLAALIHQHFHVAIFELSPEDIARLNIFQATMSAMRNALLEFPKKIKISHALIDGPHCPKDMPCPSTPLTKGDSKSVSIAAASIVAKVYRDNIMSNLAIQHPQYGWENNSGYGTKAHKDAINTFGITPHHRKNFKPIKNYLETGSTNPPLDIAI